MSAAQLGPARFARPAPANGLISRSRLFDRLARRPVAVVAGTAGYGKSTLVASWLAQGEPLGAVAWLALDASDQDVGRFSADLLASMRAADGEPVTTLLGLQPPPLSADPLAFVDSIHEALYSSDVPMTVVLDDIQHLHASERSLEALDRFLQWAPSTTRVILVGRTVPRVRLQRLRLEDRLELIGHRDLAFTPEETAAAVAAMGRELSAEDLGTLHRVTQGWPAGVRMAILAHDGGGGDRPALDLRRDDDLADYLTTEVLATVDPDLRSFLLVATVDERVCPSLVDAVLGSTSGEAQLERCVAQGLFVSREEQSGDQKWYRWHSLFAAQMSRRRWIEESAHAVELELRAATWWSTVDPVTAVTHALAAGDPERAGSIVASCWLGIALEGRLATVVSLVGSIPAGVTRSAELHVALAFVAAQKAQPDAARVELAAARRAAWNLDETDRARFDIRATVIDLFLVDDRAALTDVVASGAVLLRQVGDGPWEPDRATLALVQLHVGIGWARLQDDPVGALRLLEDAAETARAAGLTALELAALAETCVLLIAAGELEHARQRAERVIAAARSRGWADLRSLAPAYGYLGWLAFWRGDVRRSVDDLRHCLSLLFPHDWGMRGLNLATLALARLVAQDLPEAEAAIREAHRHAASERMPPWWPSLLNALDAMFAMATGDSADAVRRAASDPGPGYNLADCLRAHVLLRGGRPQAALDLVAAIPVERRFPHVAVLREVFGAQALHALGRDGEAHDSLERALAAAAPSQLMTPFLVAGEPLVPLLQQHLRAGTAQPELVPQILRRMATASLATVNEWGETLTAREHAILRYLATNLSNSEIADAEFVSVNTTKTHIAHLYRKLGVSSRRAAVHRAGELGLI